MTATAPPLADILSDWAARWATVFQQAAYGELGGMVSRHYAECREHPERLAEYLSAAVPAASLVEADPSPEARRALEEMGRLGITVFVCSGRTTLALDVQTGVWARRAF